MTQCSGIHWSVSTLLALALGIGVVSTAAAEPEPAPRITVSGQGGVDVAPDMALLNLTVTREAKTARAALDANSEAMAQVMKAMQEQGIAAKDLQTSNFSIQPRYTQVQRTAGGEHPAPRIDGYTVRNGLNVRVRDIAKAGAVLDKAVTLGVNEGGSIQFTNDDPSAALAQAREQAVKQAVAKARTLAQAAGVKVGKVLEISEHSYEPRPMPMMRGMAMAAEADAVPIASGENSYSVTVNMSFAIEQ